MGACFGSFLVNLSSLCVNLFSVDSDSGFGILEAIGIIIWIFGFVFEALADHQLTTHLEERQTH